MYRQFDHHNIDQLIASKTVMLLKKFYLHVLELIRNAVDAYGQTTIMVTHDQRAAAIADRVIFLADGRVAGEIDQQAQQDVLAALKEVTTT